MFFGPAVTTRRPTFAINSFVNALPLKWVASRRVNCSVPQPCSSAPCERAARLRPTSALARHVSCSRSSPTVPAKRRMPVWPRVVGITARMVIMALAAPRLASAVRAAAGQHQSGKFRGCASPHGFCLARSIIARKASAGTARTLPRGADARMLPSSSSLSSPPVFWARVARTRRLP